MSIVNNSAPRSFSQRYATQSETPAEGAKKKPDAQVWINIGYWPEGVEETDENFVTMPMGIALDTMTAVSEVGRDEESAELRADKNHFMREWQGLGATLEPGKAHYIQMENQMYVQVRRVAAKVTADTTRARPQFFDIAGLRQAAAA